MSKERCGCGTHDTEVETIDVDFGRSFSGAPPWTAKGIRATYCSLIGDYVFDMEACREIERQSPRKNKTPEKEEACQHP